MQPEQTTPLDRILEELRDARYKDLPWTRVAELVDQALAHPEFRKRYPSLAESKRGLASMAGYTPGVLQRMLVTREFLEERVKELAQQGEPGLDPAMGDGSSLLDALPFSKVEIAKRAYDVDPKRGLDLLRQIATSDVSSRELRDQYTFVVTNPPYSNVDRTGHRFLAEWRRQACGLVEQRLPSIVGNKSARFLRDKYKFRYIDVDAVSVSVKNHGVDSVDGFDFLQERSLERPSLFSKFIAQLALKASFFRNFWIVIRAADERHQELINALDQLDLKSVGVIVVKDDGTVKTVRRPERPPTPDRQDEVKRQVLQQGLPI